MIFCTMLWTKFFPTKLLIKNSFNEDFSRLIVIKECPDARSRSNKWRFSKGDLWTTVDHQREQMSQRIGGN